MSSIDATTIHDSLDRDVAARMDQLDVFDEIDSTNSYLLQQPAPGPGRHRVAVADHQTAGRGRHSREWISAPGSSLCLSVAYTFDGQPENLPGLTLAIGVAARDALSVAGVDNVLLKWPNDLVADDGKHRSEIPIETRDGNLCGRRCADLLHQLRVAGRTEADKIAGQQYRAGNGG